MTIKIIKRSDWRARQPKREGLPIVLPVPKVIVTHTMTKPCISSEQCKQAVRKIQKSQMEKHLDILYNFLIGGDGQIYEGTGFYTNNFFPKPEVTPVDVTNNIKEEMPEPTEEDRLRKEKETFLREAIRKYRDTFPTIAKIESSEEEDETKIAVHTTMNVGIIDQYKRKEKLRAIIAEREAKNELEANSVEAFRKDAPKTIGDLLEFVASYTEEVTGQAMRPPPWDGTDPHYHGNTLTIALIGDHSNLIKELEGQIKVTGSPKRSRSQNKRKASNMESVALDLISYGVKHQFIDDNYNLKWYRKSKWKEYIQNCLSWVPPTTKEEKK